jgi:hypothetical protein
MALTSVSAAAKPAETRNVCFRACTGHARVRNRVKGRGQGQGRGQGSGSGFCMRDSQS